MTPIELSVPAAPVEGVDPPVSVVDDLAFRARALAQAHALTPLATAYRTWRLGRDEASHPVPELSSWAATAFLTGYCVRRVEESMCIDDRPATPDWPSGAGWELEWERGAALAATSLVDPSTTTPVTRLGRAVVAGALDAVIGREVDKRNEHVREHLSPLDWSQFEAFVAWWVMHGYAIAVVEFEGREWSADITTTDITTTDIATTDIATADGT